MSILQSLTTTSRGTVSSLANATMYGGTTLGGVIGGVLLIKYQVLEGSLFLLLYSISFPYLFIKAAIYLKRNKHYPIKILCHK
ncbi:putative MFS family arabinose efflux permease [Peribacillus simplex]|uniref:hypothetical protein n=1 Tax=Peribacillus simplex TaxID=1478 RepID=UPI0024E22C26|nr:hypothetical protein [Peribacillus simplex]MDF9759445.1 putative MFS family arabinose efflux permease [Peribacillus simplex]